MSLGWARGASPLAAFWTLFAAALAGCVAEGAEPASAVEAPTGPAFDESTGSVQGRVLTEELQPISGAQVGVIGTELSTVSDLEGRFFLNFVPPGEQHVVVVALGFESAGKTVTVVVGAATEEILFALVALASTGPYHSTTIHKLLVSGYAVTAPRDCVYVTPSVKTCQATVTSCQPNECEIHYGHCDQSGSAYSKWGCDFGVGWKTIIAEVESKPTSAVTGKGWSFTVLGPNVSRASGDSGAADNGEKRAWRVVSEAPIRTWIDEAALLERKVEEKDWCGGINIEPGRCDWVWRIFPGPCELGCSFIGPNVGIMQEQRATVYFSYFMLEPAPKDWSAVPDA